MVSVPGLTVFIKGAGEWIRRKGDLAVRYGNTGSTAEKPQTERGEKAENHGQFTTARPSTTDPPIKTRRACEIQPRRHNRGRSKQAKE
jgi:hypothetical protein